MSQNFNFSFSGDDFEDDFDGKDSNPPDSEHQEKPPPTAQLIEPRLHTLEELASRLYLLVHNSATTSQLLCVFNFISLSARISSIRKRERLEAVLRISEPSLELFPRH